MTSIRIGEKVGLFGAAVLTAGTLAFVPSWEGAVTEICHVAGICAALTIAIMVVAQLLGPAGIALERITAALFLGGMPLVYVVRWLEVKGAGQGSTWLGVEAIGLPIYVGLAWLGLKRSPWFLVAGIIAHGVAWDAWHWLAHSAYVPDWYSVGCFVVDVALGVYLALRVPAWEAHIA